MPFLVKLVLSALVIAVVTGIAKTNKLLSAVLISLPLVSILSFIWIYLDSKETHTIQVLSYDIFWLVLGSVPFFLLFPFFLKSGINFWVSLLISCLVLAILYALVAWLRGYFLH